MKCCDVYGNEGGDWTDCIAGQEGTGGNISADPLFCDREAGNVDLDWDSPCLPRDWASVEHPCGRMGARLGGCGQESGRGALPSASDRLPSRDRSALAALWQDPATRLVAFDIEMSFADQLEVRVIDVGGRVVSIPAKQHLPAGEHSVRWDPRQGGTPSGVYYVRVLGGGVNESGRVVVTK
ncbi:MAG: hypothetical protein H6682_22975 [Candidatus Eisenbacteria bacterium]|nr:hypothetical protein [Candidatus Eisenbacteria bacterium]